MALSVFKLINCTCISWISEGTSFVDVMQMRAFIQCVMDHHVITMILLALKHS